MITLTQIAKLSRYYYRKIITPPVNSGYSYQYATAVGQQASDLIKLKLSQSEPVMICRFGSAELGVTLNYLHQKKTFRNYFNYITGRIDTLWWNNQTLADAFNNAGIFPVNEKIIIRFAELMLTDIKLIDILGSWRIEEKYLSTELASAIRVRLPDLEPYYHPNPWSEILKHKTILVIHPFAESIEMQYEKRQLLFNDNRVLPDFTLKTIKAVQSIAGAKTEFKDWFDALEYMKSRINETEFDIAILGCGAYGLPLAAHIKRIGKKAVHLGGATQILFGIIGKRWEDHDFIRTLINQYWIRPKSDEIPTNFIKVENGCYW